MYKRKCDAIVIYLYVREEWLITGSSIHARNWPEYWEGDWVIIGGIKGKFAV